MPIKCYRQQCAHYLDAQYECKPLSLDHHFKCFSISVGDEIFQQDMFSVFCKQRWFLDGDGEDSGREKTMWPTLNLAAKVTVAFVSVESCSPISPLQVILFVAC